MPCRSIVSYAFSKSINAHTTVFPICEILFTNLPYCKHLVYAFSTLPKPTLLLPYCSFSSDPNSSTVLTSTPEERCLCPPGASCSALHVTFSSVFGGSYNPHPPLARTVLGSPVIRIVFNARQEMQVTMEAGCTNGQMHHMLSRDFN